MGSRLVERPYIVLELLSGESLHSLLHRWHGQQLPAQSKSPPMTDQERHAVLLNLVRACEYLSVFGLAHRDLRPCNVQICQRTPSIQLKLLDLGVAIATEQKLRSTGNPAVCAFQSVKGGAGYEWLPPEATVGNASNSNTVLNFEWPAHSFDVYSLGVLWLELSLGIVASRVALGLLRDGQECSAVESCGHAEILRSLLGPPERRPPPHQLRRSLTEAFQSHTSAPCLKVCPRQQQHGQGDQRQESAELVSANEELTYDAAGLCDARVHRKGGAVIPKPKAKRTPRPGADVYFHKATGNQEVQRPGLGAQHTTFANAKEDAFGNAKLLNKARKSKRKAANAEHKSNGAALEAVSLRPMEHKLEANQKVTLMAAMGFPDAKVNTRSKKPKRSGQDVAHTHQSVVDTKAGMVFDHMPAEKQQNSNGEPDDHLRHVFEANKRAKTSQDFGQVDGVGTNATTGLDGEPAKNDRNGDAEQEEPEQGKVETAVEKVGQQPTPNLFEAKERKTRKLEAAVDETRQPATPNRSEANEQTVQTGEQAVDQTRQPATSNRLEADEQKAHKVQAAVDKTRQPATPIWPEANEQKTQNVEAAVNNTRRQATPNRLEFNEQKEQQVEAAVDKVGQLAVQIRLDADEQKKKKVEATMDTIGVPATSDKPKDECAEIATSPGPATFVSVSELELLRTTESQSPTEQRCKGQIEDKHRAPAPVNAAQRALRDVHRRPSALSKLHTAIKAKDVGMLRAALADATQAGVSKQDTELVSAARALADAERSVAQVELDSARAAGEKERLQCAISSGRALGVDMGSLALAEQKLAELERRAAAVKDLTEAAANNNVDVLRETLSRIVPGVLPDDDKAVISAKRRLMDADIHIARKEMETAVEVGDASRLQRAIEHSRATGVQALAVRSAELALIGIKCCAVAAAQIGADSKHAAVVRSADATLSATSSSSTWQPALSKGACDAGDNRQPQKTKGLSEAERALGELQALLSGLLRSALADASAAMLPDSDADVLVATTALKSIEVGSAVSNLTAARTSGDIELLNQAIEAGRDVGIDEDTLGVAERDLLDLQMRADASSRLQAAVESSDQDALRAALDDAAAIGFPQDHPDVMSAASALRTIKVSSAVAGLDAAVAHGDLCRLESAIDHARAVGISVDKVRAAEQALDEARRRVAAVQKLQLALSTNVDADLRAAIADAQCANLPSHDNTLVAAKSTLQKSVARTELQCALKAADIERLRLAIDRCRDLNFESDVVEAAEQSVVRMELRRAAAQKLDMAIEKREVGALRDSLARATAAGIRDDDAKVILAMSTLKVIEAFSSRAELQSARAAGDIQRLRASIEKCRALAVDADSLAIAESELRELDARALAWNEYGLVTSAAAMDPRSQPGSMAMGSGARCCGPEFVSGERVLRTDISGHCDSLGRHAPNADTTAWLYPHVPFAPTFRQHGEEFGTYPAPGRLVTPSTQTISRPPQFPPVALEGARTVCGVGASVATLPFRYGSAAEHCPGEALSMCGSTPNEPAVLRHNMDVLRGARHCTNSVSVGRAAQLSSGRTNDWLWQRL